MVRRDKKRRGKVRSARKRAEEHKSGFERTSVKPPDGVEMFSPDKAGVYRIDIVPYTVTTDTNPYAEEGDQHFERTFFTHRAIGPNEDTVVCLAKTFKKPCPVCEHRAKLAKDPDADEQLVKDLGPKERQLWNVLDHDEEDKGVQLWDISFHLFGKQLDARVKNSDEDDGYEYFHDPNEGMTLKVGMAERSFAGNKFLEAESIDFKKRKPLDDDILDAAVVLDDCLVEMDYDSLKKMFLQTGDDDDDQETDKDDRPTKRQSERNTDRNSTKSDSKKDEPEEQGDGRDDAGWDDEDEDDIPFDGDTDAEEGDVNKVECPACEGSGKSSKGRKCVPCKGTGYLERAAEEDEPDEDPTPSETKKSKGSSKKTPKPSENTSTDASGDDEWDDWDE